MNETILTAITISQLEEIIAVSVRKVLEEHENNGAKPNDDDNLLKINEVCKLFKVSKMTMHNWKKKELIPFYRISNKVYFKKSDVLAALKKANSIKTLSRGV